MTTIEPAATHSDIQIIAHLAHEIWTEHYTPIIGSAQVEYMIEKFQSVAAIKEQIGDGVEYHLVRYQGDSAGYISAYKKKESLFLSKIYVLSSLRGKGIGKTMMNFISERAHQLSCENITLTVNKYNTNSINAYKRMGFLIVEPIVIDIGNGFIMDDYLMKKALEN